MTEKKTAEFDGIESLRSQGLDGERWGAPRALGVAAMCLLVLGVITAGAALAIAAVVAAPVLIGVILLHI